MNTNTLLEHTSFVVLCDRPLTNEEQKILTHLYMPLIGPKSINIYMTLRTFVQSGEVESMTNGHLKLFQLLQIKKENDFIKERNKLEAVGLLEVFESSNIYAYKVKQVKSAEQFFNDDVLRTFLYQKIQDEDFNNLMMEFLVYRTDFKEFKNITKSFDDVFEVDAKNNLSYLEELNSLIITPTGEMIKVNNPHFDYKYFNVLIGALDILDNDILSSRTLYDYVNRYSFLYQLTTEEIKDAVIASVNIDKNIDYDVFKKTCKKIYDKHEVKPKIIKTQNSTSDDKLINFLDVSSPNVIVENLFGVGLVSSEIEMFDKLLNNTGISLGILNVLIIYVLKDKNGEVPSYNYFDKIIKTWQRMGISSTKEAMDYINGRNQPKSTSKPKSKTNVKDVPDWYDDYIKDVEAKNKDKENKEENAKSIEELNDLFKFNKR